MRAILLNGPPYSGKDTIGGMIWRKLGGSHLLKFAQPIIDFMLREYGIHMSDVDKDAPHLALRGRTPRQVAIAYSENFCKPLFGVAYFGDRAVVRMRELEQAAIEVAIFTDSGFLHEVLPVLDECGKGRVLQIELHRTGCHFSGDSRSHWSHRDIGKIEVHNNAPSLPELRAEVEQVLVPEIDGWLIHSS